MPKKILVADDSPTIRNVADSLLRKHGYETLLAENGAKALSMAKSEKPDLLFLDSSIPVLSAEQVLTELKQMSDLKDLPVVMILTAQEKGTEQNLRQIGAQAFITRPFDPREILDHVESLLDEEGASPAADKKRAEEHIPPEKGDTSMEKEAPKGAPDSEDAESEDSLSFVQTSDLVEGFDPSAPASDEEVAHGFDWFLHELKKEAHNEEKTGPPSGKRASPPEKKVSDEKIEPQAESKVYEISENEKGFEEFVKDLKLDLGEPEIRQSSREQPSASGEMSASESDQLLSDLKERIAERVAQEVAKKISPEFLEKVIREELARVRGVSSEGA